MAFKGTWRDYQARALEEIAEHVGDGRVHIVAAPGAGKTILGLELVRRIGRPALVFAPTIAIREQWAQRLCPWFLDAMPDPASLSRDLACPRVLTLTTYQALDSFRREDRLEDLVATLGAAGPLTLVLDEAHHLRREWWRCLETLVAGLADVRIVSLTATPPYDASLAEWACYESLCGPIDFEIGIPELVRNGDLCPHQDHLILSAPTADALALLDRRRLAIAAIQQDLRQDAALLDWFEAHPWLADPESNVDAILQAPEMLSAVLVLLASSGRKLPRPPLDLLGVSARKVPAPSQFWLERLLDGLLFAQATDFPLDPARRKDLQGRLHEQGLIEGRRVRLRHTRSIFGLMASSLAKLESIAAIARAEHSALGNELRMVVLSDHIRAGELAASARPVYQPAKLGVVPIFDALRRSGLPDARLGVLTGSLVIVPREAIEAARETLPALGLSPDAITIADLPDLPDFVRLTLRSGDTASLVQLITALFAQGQIRILVGTQSLLGEGWDAPVLNSLVLASNTASFVLSNQMRGRAIRIDPARPAKVSNIWHLATVDPGGANATEPFATHLDWGHLNDDGAGAMSDLDVVARRFRAFEGISNGRSTMIEDGIRRLGIDPARPDTLMNVRTFAVAADRPGIAERWRRSLGKGTDRSQVRATAAPRYAPRALSRSDTLHALAWTAASGGVFAAASELRDLPGQGSAGTALMGLAGVAALASLPGLAKAARLLWRNGSLESNLANVTRIILQALVDISALKNRELDFAEIEVCTSLDGRKDIILRGVSRAAELQVMQAVAELLGPVQNPRYLLQRTSWLGPKVRVDYHAVPAALGTRKEDAEHFADLWRRNIGASKLVFLRSAEGRRTLLKARASSFAAGFQRSVDRRSVWL